EWHSHIEMAAGAKSRKIISREFRAVQRTSDSCVPLQIKHVARAYLAGIVRVCSDKFSFPTFMSVAFALCIERVDARHSPHPAKIKTGVICWLTTNMDRPELGAPLFVATLRSAMLAEGSPHDCAGPQCPAAQAVVALLARHAHL